MSDYVVQHWPGPLKQTNKPHKTGRHRSKNAINNGLKGKISGKSLSIKFKPIQRKQQRRNHVSQLRKIKCNATLEMKRKLGGERAPPFLICVVPMNMDIDAQSALTILKNCDSEAIIKPISENCCYMNLPRFKKRYMFIIPPIGWGNEFIVLDYLKVCDTTLLLTSATANEDAIFDAWGYTMFKMMSAQHIPTPIVAVMDFESLNVKKNYMKATVQKFISRFLPKERIMQLDTNNDGLNIMRRISTQKKDTLRNRDNRPHLFSDHIEFKFNNHNQNIDDDITGDLHVTGFLRGVPLDVNELIHIIGLGDFQMTQILELDDPYKLDQTRNLENKLCLIYKADPLKQTSLQSENIPDVFMDHEQANFMEKEIMDCKNTKKSKLIENICTNFIKCDASGTTKKQGIIKEDEDINEGIIYDDEMNNNEDECSTNDDFDNYQTMSCDEDACEPAESNYSEQDPAESTPTLDIYSNDRQYDEKMDFQEERDTLQKIKEEHNDRLWPDEVDTPQDVPARLRFRKYRGLESFRTSPWDNNESLPTDYSRIYQFQNFERTKRRILAESKNKNGVNPGSYVTIVVSDVMLSKWRKFKSSYNSDKIILYGLLPHEHQMSVLNVLLKRSPDSEDLIKSKEPLIVQCGYRRFTVQPIYSQHTNGNKHKFERYFRPHSTVCATFYAPIQYPVASVLAFKRSSENRLMLKAHGSLLSCNPGRIIVKRIVITGHPMRIYRKTATIRYMFFNKEDVDYFKPVKLRTKCGRLGHIKQSLGTHGHMKCVFDGELRSYDTVLMYLYKRIYPKWTYEMVA